jgi:two-component system response regulator
MPRKGGLEALAEIKGDPALWKIPAIVLTSSRSEADVFSAYQAGATSFMMKPGNFGAFVEAMRVFGKWWLETVRLPSEKAFPSLRLSQL